MKTIKTVSLALVAVFAIGATVAESTSAAPPEFTKEKVLGFAFLEHTLTQAPVNHLYVKLADLRIDCWSEAIHALALKIGIHAAVVTLGMCMAEQTERKERCSVKSPGAEKGEIITKELEGKLGYINKAAKEVGLLLNPSGSSKEFAVLAVEGGSCFGFLSSVSMEGSVIGKAGPTNLETTEFELVFSTVAEEQAITKFEGVSGEDVLTAFGFHVGLEAKPKVVFNEKEKLEA